MSHTVVWLPAAEEELAELWLTASDRDAITRASLEIECLLRIDPENEGESRQDQRRVLIAVAVCDPVRQLFTIYPDSLLTIREITSLVRPEMACRSRATASDIPIHPLRSVDAWGILPGKLLDCGAGDAGGTCRVGMNA